MNLQQAIAAVQPPCEQSRTASRRRFSDIAIPLGSLGLLQEAVAQLAAIQRTERPSIEKRAVVMFCADNGVVAQGVTQCGQEVTATVTENMGRGQSTVCLMAAHIGMDSFPVDIGVARDVEGARILRRKIRYGTADMTREPAMTRAEAVRALETGIELAEWCASQGYRLVCGGEMGIGNTTSSAAVTAALTGAAVPDVTGRGAGLSTEGLDRKVRAIQTALDLHRPDPHDPIDVLHKVGGAGHRRHGRVLSGRGGLRPAGGAGRGDFVRRGADCGAAMPRGARLSDRGARLRRAGGTAAAGYAGLYAVHHRGHASGRRHGCGRSGGAARSGARGLRRHAAL